MEIVEKSKSKIQQLGVEGKLLQATAAAEARMRQKHVNKVDRFHGSENQGFVIGQPQLRAVPQWRQNM